MRQFCVILSCLIYLAAAKVNYGLSSQNMRDVGSEGKQYPQEQNYYNHNNIQHLSQVNQRQKFILDVLLQVQKPLVNSAIIELGQNLNTQDNMYTVANDEYLQEFLNYCRNGEILGINEFYTNLDYKQSRQFIGLYRFFVLARDYSIFEQNVAYARQNVNAVMFVNAFLMAVQDRYDTRDLIVPALNEVLPNLFYDKYVIETAQNIDYSLLSTGADSLKPNFIDTLRLGGLFRPYKNIRQYYEYGRNQVYNRYGYAPSQSQSEIVIPAQKTQKIAYLSDDCGLNVFWNNVLHERLLQTSHGRKQGHLQQERIGQYNKNSYPYNYDNRNYNIDYYSRQYDNLNYKFNNEYGRYGNYHKMGSDRYMNVNNGQTKYGYGQIFGNTFESSTDERLPEMDIHSDRLLYVNRRRLHQQEQEQQHQPDQYQYQPQQYENSGYNGDFQQYEQKNYNNYEKLLSNSQRQIQHNNIRNERHVPSTNCDNNYNKKYYNKKCDDQYKGLKYDSKTYGLTYDRRNPYYNQYHGLNRPIVEGDRLMAGRQENPTFDYVNSRKEYRESNGKPNRVEVNKYLKSNVNLSISKYYTPSQQVMYQRSGEIFIQNLRQLIARINLEKIAMQMDRQDIESHFDLQLLTTGGILYQQSLGYDNMYQQIISKTMQQLRTIIDREIERRNFGVYDERVLDVISYILMESTDESGINVWDTLFNTIRNEVQGLNYGGQQSSYHGYRNYINLLSQPAGYLRSPIYRQIIYELVQLLDEYVERLPGYTLDKLRYNDVNIKHIKTDLFKTYQEEYDSDLINIIDYPLNDEYIEKMQKKIVVREQRLNHEAFTINYCLMGQRSQRVVVRTFLGPKYNDQGIISSLEDRRHNFILLDAFDKELTKGINYIDRSSYEMAGYAGRTVSKLSEIYKCIWSGETLYELKSDQGRYPHRLLLPRGAAKGLPMQLLVIITPLSDFDYDKQKQIDIRNLYGLGISSMNLDELPLNYPLDRKIEVGEQDLLQLPNIVLQDIEIVHVY